MRNKNIARLLFVAAALFFASLVQSCATGQMIGSSRPLSYHVASVLDGKTKLSDLAFSFAADQPGIPILDVMYHRDYMRKNAKISPDEHGTLHMVLGYQLMPGKTKADIAKFKEFDRPWVVENNGFNTATYFTTRTPEWPFDAFEDITFKTKADFDRAYAGNDTMTKAGEGLFDKDVLVAVVEPAQTK